MRELRIGVIYKRGCLDCSDCIHEENAHTGFCIHDSCPYRELDSITNWKQHDAPNRKRSERMLKKMDRKEEET